MSPRPGRLLIAEPMLGDHFFQRSVVLLVQHSGDIGSLGFILNKKTGFLLNEVIPELKELPDMDIYLGGPMAPDHLFFVHSLGDLIIPDTQPINEHLYFGGNFEALKTYILAGYDITDKVNITVASSAEMDAAITEYKEYIANQVLANRIEIANAPIADATTLDFEDFKLDVKVVKA